MHYSPALEALIWLFEEEQSPPSKLEDVGDAHQLFDESPTKHLPEQTEEKDEDYSLGRALHGCELLGNEVGQPHLLIMRSVKADHQLFDKIPELTAGEQTEGNGGVKSCEDSAVCLSNDLRYEAGVIGDNSSTKFSPKSKFELDDNFWVDGMLMIVFDTGGSPLFHNGCDSFESSDGTMVTMVIHNGHSQWSQCINLTGLEGNVVLESIQYILSQHSRKTLECSVVYLLS